jgi:hypothetical protein
MPRPGGVRRERAGHRHGVHGGHVRSQPASRPYRSDRDAQRTEPRTARSALSIGLPLTGKRSRTRRRKCPGPRAVYRSRGSLTAGGTELSASSNIYCSVNAIAAGRRSRTRDAIGAIRHVFLEADHDGPAVLARAAERRDLPTPSYVLTSSPGRLHIFWRGTGFDILGVEALQQRLARELGTDPAATPVSQTTRLPNFYNRKYDTPHLITVAYGDRDKVLTPRNFPATDDAADHHVEPVNCSRHGSSMERARRYVDRVPPAITGQHGDLHTFRVCCRLVRGFALDDDEAIAVLATWNARCQPPWNDAELRDKLRRARRYGREPIGGLL